MNAIYSLSDPTIDGTTASFEIDVDFQADNGETLVFFSVDAKNTDATLTAGDSDYTAFSFALNADTFGDWFPIGKFDDTGHFRSSFEFHDYLDAPLSNGQYTLGVLTVDFGTAGAAFGEILTVSIEGIDSVVGYEDTDANTTFYFANLSYAPGAKLFVPTQLTGASEVDEGSPYTLNISGVSLTNDYVINWGDGQSQTIAGSDLAVNGDVTHVYADGDSSPQIIVQFVDDEGMLVPAGAFPLSVKDVAPTTLISGAPAVNEGAEYTLTVGEISDPGQDVVAEFLIDWDDGMIDTYSAADLPADGQLSHVFSDDGTRTVSITVIDEDGVHPVAGSLAVTVDDVAPTINITADATVDEDTPFTVTIGPIVDPGDDSYGDFSINWGDGTNETGTLADGQAVITHSFDEPNNYSVIVTVTDDDGTATNMVFEVTVDPVMTDAAPEFVGTRTGENLLVNGSFEQGPLIQGVKFYGDTTIPGWRLGTEIPSVGSLPVNDEVDGLVGWWELDSDARDYVGLADGQFLNGAEIDHHPDRGSVAAFDGRNDLLKIDHTPDLLVGENDSDFSVSFWFKPRQSATGRWRTIIHKGNSNSERAFAMWMRPHDNRIRYRLQTSASSFQGGDTNSSIPVHQWSHLTYVREGNQLKFYINGQLDSIKSVSGTSVSNDGPIYVGDNPWYSGSNSMLDDLRIYNEAKDPTEIGRIYNAGTAAVQASGHPGRPAIELWHETATHASAGDTFFELDSSEKNFDQIYQDIQTVAGQQYELSFDMLRREGGSIPDTNAFEVYWDGQLVSSYEPTDNQHWENVTLALPSSTTATTRLEIRELPQGVDLGSDSWGPFLDDFELFAFNNSESFSVDVSENAEVGFEITSVFAIDPEGVVVSYSIAAGNEDGLFAMDPDSGIVTLLSSLDYETTTGFALMLQASDGKLTDTITLNVNVVDGNDAPVIIGVIDGGENLLINGSFEEGPLKNNGWDYYDDIGIPGWTTGGIVHNGKAAARLEVWKNFGEEASHGSAYLEIDSTAQVEDRVYQDVTTVAGKTYQLSFEILKRTGSTTDRSNDVELWWDGQFLAYYSATSPDEWQSISSPVTATSNTSRLEFREISEGSDLGGDSFGPLLDNVRLVSDNATTNFSVEETARVGTIIATVLASDSNGDTLSYLIDSGNEDGAFAIHPSTGVIFVAGNISASSYSLTVQASDGSLSDSVLVEISVLDVAAKFLVVDTGSPGRTFRYDANGDYLNNQQLIRTAPRGIATNFNGSRTFVIDHSRWLDVHEDEVLVGSWKAPSVASPKGIAVYGDDIWIVSSKSDRVYFFEGATAWISGDNRQPTSSFALHSSNNVPSGITSDGTTLYVTDRQRDRVYVYSTRGAYEGSWRLDDDNRTATGITLDPSAGTTLWIVDRNDVVYEYQNATGRRTGSLDASSRFELSGENANAEGIADPITSSVLNEADEQAIDALAVILNY